MKLKDRKQLKEFRVDEFYETIMDKLDCMDLDTSRTSVITHIKRIFTYCDKDETYIIENIIKFAKSSNLMTSGDEETFIFRYGPKEGKLRFEKYRNLMSQIHRNQYKNGRRIVTTVTVDDYINLGYSREDAENKVSLRKINAGIKSAEAQKNKFDQKPNQIGYWVKKGCLEDEAKQKVSEHQTTFSLEKCIEKYGEDAGRKRWNLRQEKWQNTLNSKTEEEKREINKKKASYIRPKYDSVKENKILSYIEDRLRITIIRQHVIYLKNVNSHRSFDGLYNNILIEFNGDYWHCNPNKYDGEYYNEVMKKTASEIWMYDNNKKIGAENLGYVVFVIWEFEMGDMDAIVERFKNVSGL